MTTLTRFTAFAVLLLVAVPAFARTPVAPATCLSLGSNLSVGARDSAISADVAKLQAYLIEAGLLRIEKPTGYFGGQTRAAVMAFQKKEGLTAQGFVGPQTRPMLSERSCPNAFTFSAIKTPDAVVAGQEALWTVAFTAPSASAPIEVSAIWGDEPGPLVVSNIHPVRSTARVQYVNFTHTYEKPGTYQVEFKATHASSSDPIYIRDNVTVK